MKTSDLTPLEVERYARHMALPHWGQAGQVRLKKASALVVGLGGLGSVSALYLSLAGVGTIGLIDDDQVSLSNLHRQTLYASDDVGTSKLKLAIKRLKAHNPEVELWHFPQRLTVENAGSMIKDFDLVLDGTDNQATRQVINQTCVAQDKAYIYGAVNLFDGQVSVFHSSQGPCLACIFPRAFPQVPEKRPEQLAVLNTLPAVIGALQATEAIKILVGIGSPLSGELLIYHALGVTFDRVKIDKNPDCPVCGG